MDADRTGTPQGGAARVLRHKYFAQQDLGAGAIHLPRACSISLGWSNHRKRNPKIRPSAFGRWSYFWRSGWDSNPREVSLKLISSQPRYDHFDTAAYGKKSPVYYDTTGRKRQALFPSATEKVHRNGLPLRWTDRADRFVLIHTHSSKMVIAPCKPYTTLQDTLSSFSAPGACPSTGRPGLPRR